MALKVGQKLKQLRLASDLTQTELADRANLTKGFISQLEHDQTSVGVDSMADICDALGVSLSDFFSDEPASPAVFAPKDRIQIEGKGATRFELLVTGSTNNMMDPVMIELAPGEALEQTDPHPGEQFGYVMKGNINLLLDKKSYRVPSKHCLYFTTNRTYQISNSSDTTAKLLWITTPPQM